MDFKKLEYLESVYRLRNFTKAAEEQYISQPSISSAIQSLESELNVTLINRNTRPLSFTAAGEEFMQYVEKILLTAQLAQEAMQRISGGIQKTLRIAFYSSSASQLIPKIYTEFYDHYPEYNIHITEAPSSSMLEQLLDNRLDMAYTLIPEKYDTEIYRIIPLQSHCQLCAMISRKHPLSKCSSVSLTELKDELLITYPPGALIRQKLDAEFRELGISPRTTVPHRTGLDYQMVKDNLGIAFVLLDSFSNLDEHSDVTLVKLNPPIYFQTGFLLKKGAPITPVMKAMISYVKELTEK